MSRGYVYREGIYERAIIEGLERILSDNYQ